MVKYINITLNYILSKDRQLNWNYKYNYKTILTNILLLPTRQLGKVAAIN